MENIKRAINNKYSLIALLCLFWVLSKAQVTQTFTYTGATQSFVIPPCVSTISVDVRGAQGANAADKLPSNSSGGLGGRAQAIISVVPGQIYYMTVGGVGNVSGAGGFNGGGAGGLSTAGSGACAGGPAGGGGGASDIRFGGTAIANRIVVAGGGGGAGRDYCNGTCLPCGCGGNGGAGGGVVGVAGQPANTCNSGSWNGSSVNFGGGATGTAGGTGGPQDPGTGTNAGTAGSLGQGGVGSPGQYDVAGGGGGGGYYGGGGGGGAGNGSGIGGGGGGGGSSFFSGVTGTISTPSVQVGDGQIVVSYFFSGALTSGVASPSAICTGSNTTLSASGQVSYTWSPGGSNASSIVVSPTVTSTYTIQGTNSQGCVSIATIAVVVNTAVPTLTVASTATAVCSGKSLIITASGANTYTWTNGITNGVTYTPAATSTYVVSGENACGVSTESIAIAVNPIPPVTASVNNPTICSGSSIILNGGGGTSYTWTPSAPNNAAFVPPNTANYTVTGQSANGCTASAVAGVTVLITPTVAPVVTPTAICFGQTATLSATGATGYTWTPGTNPNTPTVQVSPPGPTTYTLVRTNGACSNTSTVTLIVNPLPLVNASANPAQICAGTGVNMLVLGPVTNTWLPGGFTASNFTLYPNASTCYTVTGSNGNCTTSAVVCVTVNASPAISITSSTNTICQGQTVNFTANGNAATYTWQPMGTNVINETLSPPTTTIVSLMGTNAAGCTSTVNQLIVVNQLPNMTINSSVPFACEGQSALISIANPSNNVVYNWNTGPTGPVIQVNPLITTVYSATGTNTNTGCTNNNSYTLAVYISTFAVSSPTAICKGATATLTASGPATSYSWTANGGVVSPTVAVTPLNNITYYVTGTNGSCSSTKTVPIIVNPLPNVTASVAKSTICRFEIATITGNGATTYSWNTGATTQVLTFTLSISTNYTLTGTDNNGCSKTTTVTQFVATCPGMGERELNDLGVSVFPNPNNGSFVITSTTNITVNLVNALGQVVATINLPENSRKEVTVTDLPAGIYFINGNTGKNKLNKKIVIEK